LRLFAEGREKAPPTDVTTLAHDLLGDDPLAIIETLKMATRNGARATDLSKALCYAAALRIARFGTANEFGDWIRALHTFTYCNALHQSLKRLQEADDALSDLAVVRGIFHGAISVYQIALTFLRRRCPERATRQKARTMPTSCARSFWRRSTHSNSWTKRRASPRAIWRRALRSSL
jgi:hypothetical protein